MRKGQTKRVCTAEQKPEFVHKHLKEERYLDPALETVEDVPKLLDEYVYYFNNRRHAAAPGF